MAFNTVYGRTIALVGMLAVGGYLYNNPENNCGICGKGDLLPMAAESDSPWCAWQTTRPGPSLDPVYAQLSAMQANNRDRPVGPLIGGAALCLYKHGVFCKGDSDIDLANGVPPHSPPPGMEVPATKPPISFDHGDRYHRFGVCQCRLPNNYTFACVDDIKGLASAYGASWWVPNLKTKPSLIAGSEVRSQWVKPWRKSIMRYDVNSNSIIETQEIQPYMPSSITLSGSDIDAAAAEMTQVLRSPPPYRSFARL